MAGNPVLTVDYVAPGAVASIRAINADTGSSNSDYITNQAIQTVTGVLSAALAAGEKVQVSADGATWWDATVGVSSWMAPVLLGDGTFADSTGSLSARTLDAAGNATAGGNTKAYRLDTTRPGTPILALHEDTGNSSDRITSNGQVDVVLGETLSAGGAGGLWEYNVNNTGWNLGTGLSFTITGDGAKSVLARQTDAAGNVSVASAPLAFRLASIDSTAPSVIDTTPPSKPTIDVVNSSDSGASPIDNISMISTPQVLVTLGAGSAVGDVVRLKAGSASVGSYTLGQTDVTNGSVTITASNLGVEATYVLTAYVTDLAGNVGAASDPINYVLDLTNATPTASLVGASGTSFTILASDVDSEPDWTTLRLSAGINGLISVNDGSNQSFNVQPQVVSVVTPLTVTDGTNFSQVATQTGKSVTVIQGTDVADNFNPVADSVTGIYYGYAGNDSILGGPNSDYIFGGAGNDSLTGAGGNDIIDLGTGRDTLVLRTSGSLNGTDSVTGDFNFNYGDANERDVLTFQFGISGGLDTLYDLRGNGTSPQRTDYAVGTLASNTGLLISAIDISDATAAKNFVQGLSGEAPGDIFSC